MNNRRGIFIILIVLAVLALGAIVWWLVAPLFQPPASNPAEQPPELPVAIQPTTPVAPTATQAFPPPPRPTDAEQRESYAQDVVMQRAKTLATALGTYSSAEGFASLRDLKVQSTAEMQAFLDSEQQRLVALHPSYGPAWSQSIRALSARIQSPLPVLGKTEVDVQVQAQQTVESDQQSPEISYQVASIKMVKVGEVWFARFIRWEPFQP